MTERDAGAAASDRGFLEWMAEEVETRILRSLPPEEREAAQREFRAALGRILSTAPMPRHGEEGSVVAELGGRARIAAAFHASYGDDPPDDPSAG